MASRRGEARNAGKREGLMGSPLSWLLFAVGIPPPDGLPDRLGASRLANLAAVRVGHRIGLTASCILSRFAATSVLRQAAGGQRFRRGGKLPLEGDCATMRRGAAFVHGDDSGGERGTGPIRAVPDSRAADY